MRICSRKQVWRILMGTDVSRLPVVDNGLMKIDIWSRQESIIGHGKRHATVIRAKWGATKDGKIVAIENEIIGDGGAYMYTSNKVLGNSTITSSGPYNIPNIKTDVYGVYTNNVPGAAFRGFGAPQALFMAEMQMNKLAET